MTTDEMIEVMARAIREKDSWRNWRGESSFQNMARAALAAILPVLREEMLPEASPSDEAIDEAFKAVSYKYFGDYALSEGQWDAVWTMHGAAWRVKSIRARFDQIAKEIEG